MGMGKTTPGGRKAAFRDTGGVLRDCRGSSTAEAKGRAKGRAKKDGEDKG
jgi:hypothetical protein